MVDTDAARRQAILSIVTMLRKMNLESLIIIQKICKNIH